jgi:hypothetical protein
LGFGYEEHIPPLHRFVLQSGSRAIIIAGKTTKRIRDTEAEGFDFVVFEVVGWESSDFPDRGLVDKMMAHNDSRI